MNIVLQHWTGDLDELGEASAANMQAYAERIGAEYALLRGDVFRPGLHPACQKLYMLEAAFDFYEWVLMVDMDMFAVRGLAENVFTDVNGTGLFSEYTEGVFASCRRKHPTLTDERWAYWGGAIWRLHRERRRVMRAHLHEEEMAQFSGNFNDEGIMHRLACLAQIPQDRLPQRWCYCSYLPDPASAAMIHVRTKVTPKGPKRTKLENYRELQRMGVL
jgi:hypothetical protein